jgi:hypothetical protein
MKVKENTTLALFYKFTSGFPVERGEQVGD